MPGLRDVALAEAARARVEAERWVSLAARFEGAELFLFFGREPAVGI
jgi:hypothetical protein